MAVNQLVDSHQCGAAILEMRNNRMAKQSSNYQNIRNCKLIIFIKQPDKNHPFISTCFYL
jgi:hypothetical protein